MKSVIFIAPPASGKGTQSAILEKLGYSHISAGDILRKEIESKSDFGLKIKDIMAKGNLVNDDDVHKLMRKAIIKAKKPFILDGYPRTSYQTNLLNNLFNELDINDYKVIYLDITLEEALKRSLGRLTCSCGASYNKYYENLKPQVEGICDVCGKKLIIRDDDNETSFRKRFETFKENTEPIKKYYKKMGKLYIVNAMEESSIIADRIKEILND